MKKSTLITTIAMIVVVVVALSTATYAWFTSSTTATTSGHISVISEAGWFIMGSSSNALDGTSETFAYDSTVSLDMNMLNGLYSPTAPIATALTDNNLSNTTTSLASWYNAIQTGVGQKGSATVENPSSLDPISGGKPSAMNYIRVENTFAEPKNLTLTITVSIATTASDIQKNAAKQLCAYATINNQGTAKTANTAYDYGSVDGSTASKINAVGTYSVEASSDGDNTYAINEVQTNRAQVSSSTTALDTKYTGQTTENDGTHSYYQLTINFGSINPGSAVNIGIYIWFNGWRIDTTANGTEADVFLAFGTTGE